jgi:hypothetical protein
LTLNPGSSDNAIVINNDGFIKFTTTVNSYIRGFATSFGVLDNSYVSRVFFTWGGNASFINTGGNLLIGTTTDAGYKLDVNGTGRITGDFQVDGDFYQNGIQGYTGTFTIIQDAPNPPINVEVNGGIITNVT